MKQKYNKTYWDKIIEYNEGSMISRFFKWLKKKQKGDKKQNAQKKIP